MANAPKPHADSLAARQSADRGNDPADDRAEERTEDDAGNLAGEQFHTSARKLRWWQRRPRSMLAMVAISHVLVAVPLLAAVPLAYQDFNTLITNADRAISEAVNLTEQAAFVDEQLSVLERQAQQYIILEDPDTLQRVRERIARLERLSSQIAGGSAAVSNQDRDALATYLAQLREEFADVPIDSRRVSSIFTQLVDLRARIVNGVQIYVDDRQVSIRGLAEESKRDLLLPVMALIPATLILVLIFTVLIMQPFRQLSLAIRRVARGKLDQPVRVGGLEEIRRLGAQLDTMRRNLAEADADKNRFLRHMSHELKTPLASIVEGVGLLQDPNMSAPSLQAEITGILQHSSQELHNRIHNLLRYSEWVDNNATPKFEAIDIDALFEQLRATHALAAAAQEQRVTIERSGLTIVANTESLRVAVDNLVSNALRYTPAKGAVTLQASRVGSTWQIAVRDTGPGIPVDDQERVFSPFVQGSTPASGAVKGSGIGLSLVREAVRMHDGEVTLRCPATGGTIFTLHLPHRELANEANQLTSP